MRVDDRVELHELAARYGTAIDDRDWDALSAVFTADALYVLDGFGDIDGRYEGWPAIRALMAGSTAHPVAHHVTNVVVDEADDPDGERARMRSKIVGPGPNGRVGSADYDDVVVRTPDGWRIASRTVTRRRPMP